MEKNISNSVLLSIFRRKGGEGKLTEIISLKNADKYNNLLKNAFESNDENLIGYLKDLKNWLILTNRHLIYSKDDIIYIINNSEIVGVSFALKEEMKKGIKDKQHFTMIEVAENGKSHIITIEAGKPYQGFYQVLSFIAGNNINNRESVK
ncbi:hypothetical protein [Emticicia sp. 17c]|uniref:hypothetical protein n=1 Tax=Emticicia sp. 17c TaxID=3127704 RepID=UPI00301D73B4